MSLQVVGLLVCLLVTCVNVCKGLEVTIDRTPGSQYCAHLRCEQTVSQTDKRISYLIGLSIYNTTLKNSTVKFASVSLFDPDLHIDHSKADVINGSASLTASQGHLALSFQDVTDCLHGSFLCELDFVNASGQPDVLRESTSQGDSSSCTLLEDQLKSLTGRVHNLTSDTQTALTTLTQENAVLKGKVTQLTQNNTILEGKVTLLTDQNMALQSTLDHVVERLATLESQVNSSINKPQVPYRMCSKEMSYSKPRQEFKLWDHIPALCDTETDGGGWVIIQRRTRGDLDFYRNWTDYKNGFGTPATDFWIGLDVIHNLTSQGYNELRFDLQYGSQQYFAHYLSFNVADEPSKYHLEVSCYSGTAGNSFTYHSGQDFSTHDRDNDRDARNCAEFYQGAWWYNEGSESNLNGLWAVDSLTGITWNGISNGRSLNSSEVKVRQV